LRVSSRTDCEIAPGIDPEDFPAFARRLETPDQRRLTAVRKFLWLDLMNGTVQFSEDHTILSVPQTPNAKGKASSPECAPDNSI
jgi:hypothetical protein